MAGLRTLGELDLDHADRLDRGAVGEPHRIEAPVRVPTAEVAGPDLPDQVAPLQMAVGDRSLPGVVCEAAFQCAEVHGRQRVGAERAEAHRRDVQQRRRVGKPAGGRPDRDPGRRGGAAPSAAASGSTTRSLPRRGRAGCRTGSCRAHPWRGHRPASGLLARMAARPCCVRCSTAGSRAGSIPARTACSRSPDSCAGSRARAGPCRRSRASRSAR